MKRDIAEVLYSQEVLEKRVAEIGAQITKDYAGKNLMIIGILKGSNIFTSDLVRQIDLPLKMDFMVVSSYGNATESSGIVRIIKDLDESVEDYHLLIVEDIIDSGLTLHYLKKNLLSRNPQSVKICTLLDKPSRRKQNVEVDYVGFDVPDQFIVGYGIDYAELYRNLPYIGILDPSVYEK